MAARERAARAPEAEHVAVALVLDDPPAVRAHMRLHETPMALQHVEPDCVAQHDRQLGRGLDVTEDNREGSRFVVHSEHVGLQAVHGRLGHDFDRRMSRAGGTHQFGVPAVAQRTTDFADLDPRVTDTNNRTQERRCGPRQVHAVHGRTVGTVEVGDDYGVVRSRLERHMTARYA